MLKNQNNLACLEKAGCSEKCRKTGAHVRPFGSVRRLTFSITRSYEGIRRPASPCKPLSAPAAHARSRRSQPAYQSTASRACPPIAWLSEPRGFSQSSAPSLWSQCVYARQLFYFSCVQCITCSTWNTSTKCNYFIACLTCLARSLLASCKAESHLTLWQARKHLHFRFLRSQTECGAAY